MSLLTYSFIVSAIVAIAIVVLKYCKDFRRKHAEAIVFIFWMILLIVISIAPVFTKLGTYGNEHWVKWTTIIIAGCSVLVKLMDKKKAWITDFIKGKLTLDELPWKYDTEEAINHVRILWVDDEIDETEYLTLTYLQDEGYNLIGREDLTNTINITNYDIAIVDLNEVGNNSRIGISSGLNVIDDIKLKNPAIYILVYSASDYTEHVTEYLINKYIKEHNLPPYNELSKEEKRKIKTKIKPDIENLVENKKHDDFVSKNDGIQKGLRGIIEKLIQPKNFFNDKIRPQLEADKKLTAGRINAIEKAFVEDCGTEERKANKLNKLLNNSEYRSAYEQIESLIRYVKL